MAELASAVFDSSELELIADSLTDIEVQLETCRTQIIQADKDKGMADPSTRGHLIFANYAKVMALHMYNVKQALGDPKRIMDKNAVVATWRIDQFRRGQILLPACGGVGKIPKKWGCVDSWRLLG